MASAPLTHVRKRDGRLVPFARAHLVRSIEAAARACGSPQAAYAGDVADAVILHFERDPADQPPTTRQLADAVEIALAGVRQADVAAAYRAYRDARDHGRARCTVVKPLQPSLLGADVPIRVATDGGERSAAWDRSLIVRALEREARVPRAAADAIARAVEEKILASDLRRVTTTLIRALADNELLTRGFTSSLRQRTTINVPFADIEHLLAESDAARTSGMLGRRALRPFTLAQIYSEDVVQAHQRGMLALDCLDHPAAVYSDCARLPAGQNHAATRATMARAAARLAAGATAAWTWLVDDLPTALPYLEEWLQWHNVLAPGTPATVALTAADTARAAEQLLSLPHPAGVGLLVRGVPADTPSAVMHMHTLRQHGWPVAWTPQMDVPVFALRCTLNLPQTVYRARQYDLDGVIEEVYRVLELIMHAGHQHAAAARAADPAAARGAHCTAIDIAGLDAAIAILTGAGLFDSNDSRACLRVLLAVLQSSVRQAAQPYGVGAQLVLGEPLTSGKRIAAIDQSLFPELFGFLPLTADALEPIIPAYEPVRYTCDAAASRAQAIQGITLLQRHFDAGCLPLEIEALDEPAAHALLLELMQHTCAFSLDAPTPPSPAAPDDVPAPDTPRLL